MNIPLNIFLVNLRLITGPGRSSHWRCPQKFRSIRRKKHVLESHFNKVADPQACNFIQKRLQHRFYSVKFANFLKTRILKNICKMIASFQDSSQDRCVFRALSSIYKLALFVIIVNIFLPLTIFATSV